MSVQASQDDDDDDDDDDDNDNDNNDKMMLISSWNPIRSPNDCMVNWGRGIFYIPETLWETLMYR